MHVQRKLYLVDYPPWDEDEHSPPARRCSAFDTALGRTAVLICNDAWQPLLPVLAVQGGAELLLFPAASSTAMPKVEEYWRGMTTLLRADAAVLRRVRESRRDGGRVHVLGRLSRRRSAAARSSRRRRGSRSRCCSSTSTSTASQPAAASCRSSASPSRAVARRARTSHRARVTTGTARPRPRPRLDVGGRARRVAALARHPAVRCARARDPDRARGLVVRRPSPGAAPGIAFSSTVLLQIAIVLLGTGLALGQVVRIGAKSLPRDARNARRRAGRRASCSAGCSRSPSGCAR